MNIKGLFTLSILVTIFIAFSGAVGVSSVHGQAAGFARFQMIDSNCVTGPGTAISTAAGDNVWTAWGSDSDQWDPDCVRFYLGSSLPANTDIRICIQYNDDGGLFGIGGGTGSQECSGWASAGGGWSNWAHDNNDFWAIDRMRISIDSRAMTGTLSDLRIGYQASRATGDVCANGVGVIGYSPYMSAGGSWGSYIPEALNENSIACGRVRLDTITVIPPPPVTTVWVRNVTTGAAETTGNITIGQSDEVSIRWSGTNSPTCTASESPADGAFNTGNLGAGTDATVTEPGPGTSRTYTVTCNNAGGSDAASVTVTKPVPVPVTTAYVTTNVTADTASDIGMGPYDYVTNIRWNSPWATACSVSASPADGAFSGAVAAPSGNDNTVTTPPPGGSATYTVNCSNSSGSHADSVTVWRAALPMPVTTMYITKTATAETTSDINLTASQFVTNIRWSSSDATACSVSATPADGAFTGGVAAPAGNDSSVTSPTAANGTTYTVNCSNSTGSHSDSIYVTKDPLPPVTTLWVTPSNGSETLSNVTIGPSDTVTLRWSATNVPTSCTASASPADGAFTGAIATPAGTDVDVTEPAVNTSTTYTVTCSNAGGSNSDSITVNRVNPPVTTMWVTPSTGSETTADVIIGPTETITLRWSGTNSPTGCTASANPVDGAFTGGIATPSGTDVDVTEPAVGNTTTFTVTCVNGGGNDSESIVVTRAGAPTAVLEARNTTTGGGWTTASPFYITTGDQIEFQWSSTNAVNGCTKTFIAGNATSGNAPTITEPAVNTSGAFSLVCTGAGGTTPASRSTTVTTYPAVPFMSVNDNNTRIGDTITFTWDTYLNTPAQCSITGPGAPGTLSAQSGTVNITVQGASTYTITCPGGSMSVPVYLLPGVFET